MIIHTLLAFAPLALAPAPAAAQSCLELHVRVHDGLPGPEGGVLVPPGAVPGSLQGGATLGGGGRVAFFAEVQGLARNQGIFVADAVGVQAIAIGCGGAGGSGLPGSCGDPTPIGGTFSGLFRDAWFAPDTNEAGDVLFLADVAGGSAPRGLFLHRAATGAIEKVAAVGDVTSPGTTIHAVGPGSLNAHGDIAFLAWLDTPSGLARTAVLLASGGAVTVIAAPGMPGPTGPYFDAGSSFQLMPDGSTMPMGPVPDIDDEGRLAFVATEGQHEHDVGIVVQPVGGAPAWAVRYGDPTPAGGTFLLFSAPCLGAGGELAFSARFTAPLMDKAWFAGTPGAWRTVLRRLDPIGNLVAGPPADSRNPFQSLAPNGDVVLSTPVQHPDQTMGEVHLRVRRDGSQEILSATGDTQPLGTIEQLFGWPSIDAAGRTVTSALVSGGGATRGTWVRAACGEPTAYCEPKMSSAGCLPRIGSRGAASATSSGPFLVTASQVVAGRPGMLFYGTAPASTPFQGGQLCVAPPLMRTSPQTSAGSPAGCAGAYALDFGAWIASGVDPSLVAGATVFAQWWMRDPGDPQGFGTGLTDALTFTIAP